MNYEPNECEIEIERKVKQLKEEKAYEPCDHFDNMQGIIDNLKISLIIARDRAAKAEAEVSQLRSLVERLEARVAGVKN